MAELEKFNCQQTTCNCQCCATIFVAITKGFLMFCLSVLVLATAFSNPSESALATYFQAGATAIALAKHPQDNTAQKIMSKKNQLIVEQNKQLQEINIHLLRIDIALQNLTAKHKN